jgi:K+-transporting ATPase ATPase C chain
MRQMWIAVRATIALSVLTGLVYPLAVTGLAQVLFRDWANGSLVRANGRTVGSEWIGQRFTQPKYFHGRPSAADYDALASGGSNLGPTSQKLADRAKGDVERYRVENAVSGAVSGDAVTASASGLDPDITPENAAAQVGRVAAARGVMEDAVRRAVAENTRGRELGVLGEARVNVLRLNMALDRAHSETRP